MNPITPTSRTDLHTSRTLGQKAADTIASVVGSWKFILIQNGLILVWMLLNVLFPKALQWDTYPFLFLNIVMSWQAANTGPVLQMSDNRQAEKDRARDDIEAEEVALLLELNKQQLAILEKLNQNPLQNPL